MTSSAAQANATPRGARPSPVYAFTAVGVRGERLVSVVADPRDELAADQAVAAERDDLTSCLSVVDAGPGRGRRCEGRDGTCVTARGSFPPAGARQPGVGQAVRVPAIILSMVLAADALTANRRERSGLPHREMRGLPSPESSGKEWNLRPSSVGAWQAQFGLAAGISRSFERSDRTTENRGVPGSSPGLATVESRIAAGFSISRSGPVASAFGHSIGH